MGFRNFVYLLLLCFFPSMKGEAQIVEYSEKYRKSIETSEGLIKVRPKFLINENEEEIVRIPGWKKDIERDVYDFFFEYIRRKNTCPKLPRNKKYELIVYNKKMMSSLLGSIDENNIQTVYKQYTKLFGKHFEKFKCVPEKRTREPHKFNHKLFQNKP